MNEGEIAQGYEKIMCCWTLWFIVGIDIRKLCCTGQVAWILHKCIQNFGQETSGKLVTMNALTNEKLNYILQKWLQWYILYYLESEVFF